MQSSMVNSTMSICLVFDYTKIVSGLKLVEHTPNGILSPPFRSADIFHSFAVEM